MGRWIRSAWMLTAAAVVLTGCASEGERGEQHGWSYTDDRGEQVSTEEQPRNVVAQVSAAGALQDFGVPIAGTFGPLVRSDGSTEPEAGNIDPQQVTDVTGPGYGEVNLERLATLDPDVLVSGKYAEYPGLWHLTEDQESKVRDLVPTIGVQQSGIALPDVIGKYRDLARALGADVDSERVRADERDFHAAADRLRGIGARMRAADETILAVGGTEQEYFVVDPHRNPDLDFYVRELGLPITVPANPDESGGGYFERLSWENAGAYPADIMLWDARAASLPPEKMKHNPIFAAQPAAAADRFARWEAVAPMSYASYAEIMNQLADELQNQLERA